MATGTLRKKIDRQETFSTRKPPTTGPMASASALTPAHVPIALPRSCGGKALVMIERVAGIMNAAPTPWAARPATSQASVGREPDEGAREAEDDDAEEEHAAAAEDVAEPPAGDQQHGEAQRVGVDGPLQPLIDESQVALDRGQRDVHDRVVEHDHEQREAHRAEGPPAAVVVGDGGAAAGHERWGRSGEGGGEAGTLLGGERGGELLEAGEAGGLDAADDLAAGGGDAHPLHAPVVLVLAALDPAAAQRGRRPSGWRRAGRGRGARRAP